MIQPKFDSLRDSYLADYHDISVIRIDSPISAYVSLGEQSNDIFKRAVGAIKEAVEVYKKSAIPIV